MSGCGQAERQPRQRHGIGGDPCPRQALPEPIHAADRSCAARHAVEHGPFSPCLD